MDPLAPLVLHNPRTGMAWTDAVKDPQKHFETTVAQFLFANGVRPETIIPSDLQKFTWIATKFEKTGSTVLTPRFDKVRERLEAVCNYTLVLDVAPRYAGLVERCKVRYRDAASLMKKLVKKITKMHPQHSYDRVREETRSEIATLRFSCGFTPYFCAAPTVLQYWYLADL
jgi:hypothetical protein